MPESASVSSTQELIEALEETNNPAEQATLLEENMEYAEAVFNEFDSLQDILNSSPDEISERVR